MTVCALRARGVAQILFVVNFFCEPRSTGKKAGRNPWHANTLEWAAPSPPPHGNFGATLPTVYRGPYEYSVAGDDRGLPAADAGGDGRPRERSRTLSAGTEERETRET